uniref:Reverse transcriptase Ty1/copia-type domain-containing protein n=1 Tax=Fagus sylvatica TaxID=28930 RepID=A0A2N9IHB0_FAGSY
MSQSNLTTSNFLTWKFQITHILQAYSLLEYVECSSSCPSKFLDSDQEQIAPDYLQWIARDKALMSLISATLSPSAHSLIIGQSSAHGMWSVLLKRYTSVSRSNIMNLKKQLHNVKKNTDSVSQYLQKIKEARDKLAAVGTIVDDEDLLHIVLKGLPSEYESFSSAMLTKSESVPFEELHVLMLTQEELLKSSQENSKENTVMAMAANRGPQFNNNPNAQFNNNNAQNRGGFQNRGRGGFNNRGRGNNRGGFSPRGGYNPNHQGTFSPNTSGFSPQSNPNFPQPNPNRPTCQICYKPGHTAIDCYNRMNYSYQGRHPPAKLAAMASAAPSPSPNYWISDWISDTGATDHFTPDLANLPDSSLYNDSQLVSVGNGQQLPISHIGLSRDGLYPVHGLSLPLRSNSSLSSVSSSSPTCLQSVCSKVSDADLWHARLGHPQHRPTIPEPTLPNTIPEPTHSYTLPEPTNPPPIPELTLPDSISPSPSVVPPAPSSSHLHPDAPLIPVSTNIHPMFTRSKDGISKKKVFHVRTTKPQVDYLHIEPPNIKIASQIREWTEAMQSEFDALQRQHTWSLVPPPSGQNIIGCRWVYKLKHNSDGSISRYKARLVAKGFHQQAGLDFDETFSPVVKPPTVRIVLSLAAQHQWSLRQLDISNAFLHGFLKEDVYMIQPPGFVDPTHSDHVCKLQKSLYGLKQAPRAWFERFTSHLLTIGFVASTADPSLFVLRTGSTVLYLLLYVDDIILTSNSSSAVASLIAQLAETFELKDLGPLRFFLGLQIDYNRTGLFVHQRKYISDLLLKFNMTNCKPASTPFSISQKLQPSTDDVLPDPTQYRSLVGALQYATFTRPNITYAVNQSGSSSLTAFTDSDWAGDPYDHRSTTGITVFLGNNPITWVSKKQHIVSRSSTEAEYRALATGAAELAWLRQVLCDLGVYLPTAPTMWCDNTSAIALASNPVFHSRTKHIEVDYHFIRERVVRGDLHLHFISTEDQLADLFTKPLTTQRFNQLTSKLMFSVPDH